MGKRKRLLVEQGFQVIRMIGKGGFGRVYQVSRPGIGVIAAKVMKEEDFDTKEWRVGYQLTKGNTNPFVLKYHSAQMFGTQTVILMEFANMKNMDCLIESKQDLPIPVIRAIMRQLLEGLRLMHEKGIIHRDIKGQNILLHSPPGSGFIVLKIVDFGLIKEQKQVEQSTLMTVVGTMPFMSPEMLMGTEDGEVKADSKVDIWSSGILLHQLIAHEFPFKSLATQAIMMFMFNKKLKRPAQLKDDLLWELLSKMLTFDRNDRISASDALKLPFFTGPQALAEITPEIHSIASAAQTALQRGDKSVSIYDTNINFIFPVSSVKSIIGVDTDSDRTQINSQTSSDPVQQQIPIPSDTQQSNNLISLQQMSFVQPAVIRGDQIGQSAIVPKPLPKEQVKPKPKVQQIERQVPPSLNPNMLVGIIPDKQYAYQEGLKIIRTDKYGRSTVAFNPIISSGIVRFGGFFEDPDDDPDFMIGIADSSAVFGSDEDPWSGENAKKTVCYWYNGCISHIGDWIPGNSEIELNKSVSCEVNMNISPRTLTFFIDNQEQGLSVINIPSTIRFIIYLWHSNSSFTINIFENLQCSSAKGVSNGKVFQFGKEWKK